MTDICHFIFTPLPIHLQNNKNTFLKAFYYKYYQHNNF